VPPRDLPTDIVSPVAVPVILRRPLHLSCCGAADQIASHFLFLLRFIVAREFILQLLPYTGNLYSATSVGDAAAILLSLGVILEVLSHLFRPYQFCNLSSS